MGQIQEDNNMYGACIGDVVGSVYEFDNFKEKYILLDLPVMRFTDDSILTVATMDVLLHPEKGYAQTYKDYFLKYALSNRGFGGHFYNWGISKTLEPYNSYGNGSAMRVSPIGWIFDSIEETLAEAKQSAEVTHNHPEGIKGAQAIACAIYLARHHHSKEEIKAEIIKRFDYDLSRSVDDIRIVNVFNETCQGSVPEAISCFLEAENFEDTLRTAISIGGDSDTIACMACSIAEAYFGIEPKFISFVKAKLDHDMNQTIETFYHKFNL